MRSKIGSAFVLLLLTVGFAFAQKVKVDYDQSVDFSKYRTFTWIKGPETPKDPFIKQRIIDSVNMQLMSKGLQMVTNNADLAVAVHVATQEKRTLNTFYDGFGGWGWDMGGTATTTVETYTEGTIVVDFFDANTKKIIWRGVATREVSGKPGKASEEAEKAIEKLLKHFPPTHG